MNKVRISIGNAEKDLHHGIETWIREQVIRRRKAGENVCVRVTIETEAGKMEVATPACASSGGGRKATPREQKIFDLWKDYGLDSNDFDVAKLIAFLKWIEDM